MRFCFVFILMLFIVVATAQQSIYERKLIEVVNKFNHIDNDNQYAPILTQFSNLSNEYPKEWLPYYYAAIVQVKLALLNKENQDALVDNALEWVRKCKKIQINDEVLCIESLAYTTKMSVHPTWRWLSYQDRIKSPLKQAKKLNPNNPRIYVLEANLQFHLPNAFGGGCNNALPIAKQAEKLLNEEKGKSKFLPTWGYSSIKEMLNTCKY
jgi:hypothetical protein